MWRDGGRSRVGEGGPEGEVWRDGGRCGHGEWKMGREIYGHGEEVWMCGE